MNNIFFSIIWVTKFYFYVILIIGITMMPATEPLFFMSLTQCKDLNVLKDNFEEKTPENKMILD